jgi:predicted nuclease of predicted toxin-antitoxin system
VRFLLDQNLSPRLCELLADVYPGSVHVRDVGLRDGTEKAIWSYAGEHGFVIVSKDSDFQHKSLLFGSPPKFIWLRVGSCQTADVHDVFRRHAAAIKKFVRHASESHLMLP